MFASSWRRSSSANPSVSCANSRRVALQLRLGPGRAASRAISRRSRLSRSPRSRSFCCASAASSSRALLELRQQLVRRRCAALASSRSRDAARPTRAVGPASASSSSSSAARLGVARVGAQRRRRAASGSTPAGRDRDELLVQPLGAAGRTATGRPSRITRGIESATCARHARERSWWTNPCGAEAREQPLRDPLLEVQVHGRLGEHARVLEHDRPDRRLAPPVGELLAGRVAARGACRASRPSSDRAAARASSGGNVHTGRPCSSRVSRQRLGAEQLERADERVAERLARRTRPSRASAPAGCGSGRSARSSSSWRSRASSSSSPATACARRRGRPRSISSASCAASRWRIPPRSRRSISSSITCERLPSSRLDRLGLAHEHVEHVVLDPLRQHEVVAADLVRRLQLAVDPPVALLDPPRVPRQVEVEQVGAVRLEVQALPRRVGRDQDPQRVLGRVGVEAPLDLLARAGRSVRPVITAIRSSARSVPAIACSRTVCR